jgi:hypothetical protein
MKAEPTTKELIQMLYDRNIYAHVDIAHAVLHISAKT